jgi:hypothetical protein
MNRRSLLASTLFAVSARRLSLPDWTTPALAQQKNGVMACRCSVT